MYDGWRLGFDIDRAIELLRDAVRPFPRAMLFELYAD